MVIIARRMLTTLAGLTLNWRAQIGSRHHGQSTRDPVPDATRYLRSINAFPSHQSLHLSRTDRLRQLGSLVSGDEFQQHKAIAATGVDILLAQAQSNAVFARDDIEQSKIVRR